MAREILTDSDDTWIRVPYQVTLGEEFTTMRQMIEKSLGDSFGNTSASFEYDKFKMGNMYGDEVEKMFSTFETGESAVLDKPYYRDTRVGGNDAINCIWQFNRDDDIVYDITTTERGSGNGMGRVYASTTERNQQICWFTFGVPYYTPLAAFYKNAYNDELIELNNTGNTDIALGKIFAGAIKLAIFLPLLPIKLFGYLSKSTRNTYPVNRFYELRACMPLYFQYVDTILAQWLVDVGIYNNGDPNNGGSTEGGKTRNWTQGKRRDENGNKQDGVDLPGYTGAKSLSEALYGNPQILQRGKSSWSADPEMVPDALSATGASIWDILKRRSLVVFGEDTSGKNMDSWKDTFENYVNDFFRTDPYGNPYGPNSGKNAWADSFDSIAGMKDTDSYSKNPFVENSDWVQTFKSSALGATQFVGFRVDKSMDSSESFSNSTTTSSFADWVNSQVKEKTKTAIETGLKGANTGIAFVDSIINTAKATVNGVMGAVSSIDPTGLTDMAQAAISGAYIDIPEMYSDSSFSSSHSINLQLRSPYGDYVSIYQSIMVPLALIMAGALPRAAGSESYVQPFLCRVYCKGMFSVPMGIIDSLSIKRGASEFGWTYNNLPTCVDVSLSIKDMSPIMYLQLNNEYFHGIFETDNAFREYMMTLSGLGLFERVSNFARIRRNIQFAAHRFRNEFLNPTYWANDLAHSAPVRIVTAFVPMTTISRRK